MKWSTQELSKYKDEGLSIDTTLDLKSQLQKRDSEILNVSPVHVQGHLTVGDIDYVLTANVECTITLPSTRSLEPVELPLSFSFDEVYMTEAEFKKNEVSAEEELVIVLDKNLIDLDTAVVDYILLNIPMQILSDSEAESTELPSGNNWEVISEEEYQARHQTSTEEAINPKMAKLQEWMDQNDNSAINDI